MIFKPRRWRWLLAIVAAMLLGSVAVDIASSHPITARDFLLKASAYAVGATLATFLMRIDRLRVEITPSAIRGPVRRWLWFTSVEAPLADVDLLASRMSFWWGSFIRLRTGQKITLDSLFMGMKQIREIFHMLEENTATKRQEAAGETPAPRPQA